MIEHSIIVYMPNISALGGIETYVYEMVKRYKDRDICVVTKRIDPKQKRRLRKMCPVYLHTTQAIRCDVILINYDQSIIDFVEKGNVYQVFHADYSTGLYDMPHTDPRIKGYITLTKYQQKRMSELLGVKCMQIYNPLEIEEEEEPIIIVTASRLYKNKGTDLMQQFADAMDRSGISYIWYIITCDKDVIQSPNVVFIDNRLDVSKWTSKATYIALFSKAECFSYLLNEGLYRNIPLLVTPLPYLEEIGVKDGENAYIVEHDGSNIEEVVKKIKNVPKFEFKPLKDTYEKIFPKSKSTYLSEPYVKVRCIAPYSDVKLGRNVDVGEEFKVDEARADFLLSLNLVEEV